MLKLRIYKGENNMFRKKELVKELEEAKSDMLYYKSKYLLIEQLLRAQKETNSNVFTLLRDIREIIYAGTLPK